MTYLALTFMTVTALLLTIASLAVIGGAVFALLLFFPAFVLGLVGVLAAVGDRTVRTRAPRLDATSWRNGS
jgi:hypothetical protein